jgi:hypothetical protein
LSIEPVRHSPAMNCLLCMAFMVTLLPFDVHCIPHGVIEPVSLKSSVVPSARM